MGDFSLTFDENSSRKIQESEILKRKKIVSIAAVTIAIILIVSFGTNTFQVSSDEPASPSPFSSQLINASSWGDFTAVLSTESTGPSFRPSLAVGADGTVHVAWHDSTNYDGAGTDKDVFYKQNVPGVGWSSTEVVSYNYGGNSEYPS